MKIRLQRGASVPPLKNRTLFKRILQEALQIMDFPLAEPGILQFILLSEKEMTALNALHLRHQGVTDVITYDLRNPDLRFPEEEEPVLVEIYLCPAVAVKNAELYGQSPSKELLLYAIHGLLHLQGEDDCDDSARASMRAAENRVMQAIEDRMQTMDFL